MAAGKKWWLLLQIIPSKSLHHLSSQKLHDGAQPRYRLLLPIAYNLEHTLLQQHVHGLLSRVKAAGICDYRLVPQAIDEGATCIPQLVLCPKRAKDALAVRQCEVIDVDRLRVNVSPPLQVSRQPAMPLNKGSEAPTTQINEALIPYT